MKPIYREKRKGGYYCNRYGCNFTDPDFCRKRAENNVDDNCLACTGLKPVEKRRTSSIEYCTKSMNKKAA